MVGKAPWETQVDLSQPKAPFTVLTRTNVGAVKAVLLYHDLHRGQVHVVGGVEDLCWLLEDAGALKEGGERPKPHPELMGVKTWDELEKLGEVSPQIKVLLDLIQEANPYALAGYLRRAQVRPHEAKLLVSTAHKAKGREWDRVLLWDDFPAWWEDGWIPSGLEMDPEEENLFYVAMTRAREHLSLAKVPSVLEAIAEVGEDIEVLEDEEEDLLLGPEPSTEPASKGEASSFTPDLLQWSGEAALFLVEMGMRTDLPEDARKRARELAKALHRLLPVEDP